MNTQSNPIPVANVLSLFYLDNEARSLTPRTQAAYVDALRIFGAWCEGEGLHDIGAITPSDLRRYQVALQKRTTARGTAPSPAYVHYLLRGVRRLISFALAEEMIGADPFRNVKMPRIPSKVLKALSDEEVKLVLGETASRRDRAIVTLLLDTGVRSAEACALNVGDFDPASGALLVRKGKGQKGRMVYLGASGRKALRLYLGERGELDADAPLFQGRRGTRWTTNAMGQLMRRLQKRTGVAHLSAHALRRTFALRCLRNGMDLHSLRMLMGHADLEVLKQYLDLTAQDLRAAHDRFGPLDGKGAAIRT